MGAKTALALSATLAVRASTEAPRGPTEGTAAPPSWSQRTSA